LSGFHFIDVYSRCGEVFVVGIVAVLGKIVILLISNLIVVVFENVKGVCRFLLLENLEVSVIFLAKVVSCGHEGERKGPKQKIGYDLFDRDHWFYNITREKRKT
jgi:hypothetical protein